MFYDKTDRLVYAAVGMLAIGLDVLLVGAIRAASRSTLAPPLVVPAIMCALAAALILTGVIWRDIIRDWMK